jgi:hypothetical protein
VSRAEARLTDLEEFYFRPRRHSDIDVAQHLARARLRAGIATIDDCRQGDGPDWASDFVTTFLPHMVDYRAHRIWDHVFFPDDTELDEKVTPAIMAMILEVSKFLSYYPNERPPPKVLPSVRAGRRSTGLEKQLANVLTHLTSPGEIRKARHTFEASFAEMYLARDREAMLKAFPTATDLSCTLEETDAYYNVAPSGCQAGASPCSCIPVAGDTDMRLAAEARRVNRLAVAKTTLDDRHQVLTQQPSDGRRPHQTIDEFRIHLWRQLLHTK